MGMDDEDIPELMLYQEEEEGLEDIYSDKVWRGEVLLWTMVGMQENEWLDLLVLLRPRWAPGR